MPCAQKGITLIELLIAIAVFAIITMLVAPSFISYLDYQKTEASFDQVQLYLQTARIEAKNRHKPVFFCASTDRETCSGSNFQAGYIVCADNDATVGCDVTLKTGNANNLSTFTATSAAITFSPNGINTASTLTLCSHMHENSKKITINNFGQVTIPTVSAAECPSS